MRRQPARLPARAAARNLDRLAGRGDSAKRLDEPYRPGERAWVKAKHRSYWRFGE
jgi:hypothetical protein